MKELLIKIRSFFEGQGQIDAASKSVQDLGEKTEAAGNKGGGFAAKIGGWLAGLASFSAALAVAGRAMREFAAKQEAVATLDQSLRNAGQASSEYRVELQALAGQLQTTTAIGDESWYRVFETLTKFGSTNETIREHTEAVKNLAGVTGVGVEEAAFLFGKAMQGNVQMLQRYGIQVDTSLSKTEQLDQIMQQLANRGGGILEERAKTINGQIKNLQNSTGDLLASLGQMSASSGVLANSLAALQTSLDWWNDLVGRTIPPVSSLTERMLMQAQSAEEVEESTRAAAAALDAIKKAAEESDAALLKGIAGLEKQKRAAEELAVAQRQLAIEKIKASDATDEEKATRIAKIEAEAREQSLEAEKRHQEALNNLRLKSLDEVSGLLLEKRAAMEKAAAAAAEAEALAATEAEKIRMDAANKEVFEQLEKSAREHRERLRELVGSKNMDGDKANIQIPSFYKEDIEAAKYHQAALDRVNKELERRKAIIEGTDIDTASGKIAAALRGDAEDLKKELALLEERQAKLSEQAEEARKSGQEDLDLLEEKKRLEQEIADTRDEGQRKAAAAREAEKSALAESKAASKSESQGSSRSSGPYFSGSGMSPLEQQFALEDKFNNLSNQRQLQVQRDMLQQHGMNPLNPDGSKFTPSQHLAGMTPADNLLPSKLDPAWPGGSSAAPGSAASGQAPEAGDSSSSDLQSKADETSQLLEKLLKQATEGFSKINQTLTKEGEIIKAAAKEADSAAKASEGAARNLEASLANMRARLSSLEAASS